MRSLLSRRSALAAAAAVAGLSLAGCGSGTTAGQASSAASTAVSKAASAASSAAAPDVKLVKAGSLTVCTHLAYAPFQYPDDSGKVVGFDVDMMDLVAKKLGVKQEIVDTPFEGIKSGEVTKTGKCDISAAAMSITDERKKAILFSDPYYSAQQGLLLPANSTVKSLADLKGKKLGAQSATTGLDYANAQKAANGYEVIEFQDLPSQQQALLTGQVDAAINDVPVWTDLVKKSPGKAIVGPQFDTGDNYGFGMKLENAALKKVVDEVLKQAKSDGSYATIYKKWIGTEPPK
ncbi:MAG TPA: ABC transporter substrate-binding protein [Dermatophilaceae bacterium]|nr:ABC transporter substrate-binding protein [Dermatophilaceae bacterium]